MLFAQKTRSSLSWRLYSLSIQSTKIKKRHKKFILCSALSFKKLSDIHSKILIHLQLTKSVLNFLRTQRGRINTKF